MSENIENEFMKRGYLLPDGSKDLVGILAEHHNPLLLPLTPEMLKKWETLKAFKETAVKVPIKGVLVISEKTSLSDLATMLGQKPFHIMSELMKLGFFLKVKDQVSFETASLIARNYGFLAKRTDE